MKYFIIAGEASGDLHGAPLIEAIKRHDPEAELTFLGGDKMSQAAGCAPLIHYRDMAYMGFAEVLRHLGKIRRNFATARQGIARSKPDALILIDYPSFNLKMAKYAKSLGVKVFYYISPKVWAWKQWRVRTIRKVVDRMLAIFPFEVEWYKRHNYDVTYVGNPSVREVDATIASAADINDVLPKVAQGKQYIALLPGSRLGEIRENLPVMVDTIRRFPQYKAVIAGAPGVDPGFYDAFTKVNEYRRLPVVHGHALELLRGARAALVTSGTATLETALVGTPQVALYQGGGSKVLYNIMKRLLKIKHVTLPNLIAGRTVIPELLMHLCTPHSAADELAKLLPDSPQRQDMLDGYAQMRSLLGDNDAADAAAKIIVDTLTHNSER